MSDRLLSVDEVAERVGCSVRTVRRWISDGVLASVKIGGLRRVPERALDDFIGLERDWGALAEVDKAAPDDMDPLLDGASSG